MQDQWLVITIRCSSSLLLLGASPIHSNFNGFSTINFSYCTAISAASWVLYFTSPDRFFSMKLLEPLCLHIWRETCWDSPSCSHRWLGHAFRHSTWFWFHALMNPNYYSFHLINSFFLFAIAVSSTLVRLPATWSSFFSLSTPFLKISSNQKSNQIRKNSKHSTGSSLIRFSIVF